MTFFSTEDDTLESLGTDNVPGFPSSLHFDHDLKVWKSKGDLAATLNTPWLDEAGEWQEENTPVLIPRELRTGRLAGAISTELARSAASKIEGDIIADLVFFQNAITIDDLKLAAASDDDIRAACAGTNAGRKTRQRRARITETLAIHAGLIGGRNSIHKRCSSITHNRKKASLAAEAKFAESHVITGNDGRSFPLASGGATRKKRLAELYCVSKGLEQAAEAQGWMWSRIVVTVPSVMHPNPKRGKNNWDGTLPPESARWIQERWAILRACLAKLGIRFAGMWTREAHSDGCSHINFLMFFDVEHQIKIQSLFDRLFGHSEKAVNFEKGDPVKGSFATYALKYFTKFFQETPDADAIDEAAWASAWGLRRHGFFGIPSLTSWRRLRAQHEAPETADWSLRSAWRYARASRFGDWIMHNGGLGCKTNQREIRAIYQVHRASRVCVGVTNINTEESIINKVPGFYALQPLSKSAVTVILSYPRAAGTAANWDEKITDPPPIPPPDQAAAARIYAKIRG